MGKVKQTLCEKAYDILEEMIISQKLKPGSKVTEEHLEKLIGIGRTPIREALQLLARDGVVKTRPRSASIILDIPVQRKVELLEARGVIQEQTVRLACRRADVKQRAKMLILAHTVEDAALIGDNELYLDISREIHNTLCDAAQNEFLSRFMHSMYTLSRQFAYVHLVSENSDLKRHAETHSAILRAIASSDENAAVKASQEMIKSLNNFVNSIKPTFPK